MRTATSLFPAFALPVPISLYLVTLWMWLETGQGEANFTFFQCLAYCGFIATLFLEFCGASLRRDKVLRLTEKELSKLQHQQQHQARGEAAD
jgi:GPI-anchor transamidase subunit U